MIRITNHKKMQCAIERAKARRVRVQWVTGREFRVTNQQGAEYTVRFDVVGREKFAACSCSAGQIGQLCYHVPAAAALNIAIQSRNR